MRRLTRRAFLARSSAAGVSIWSGARYAVHDGARGVLRDCAYLFRR